MLRSVMRRNFSLLILSLALSACSTVVRVPGDLPRTPDQDGSARSPISGSIASRHEALRAAERGYAKVLDRYVDERGRVGFQELAADQGEAGLPALERYVSAIALVPLNQLPVGPVRLAHMINAYNALSMYNVIRSGLPPSHAGLAKLRFFVLRKFQIGDQDMSLYSFENDIIRKLNEPRIHFALNCSARSCPVLPRVPFTADTLEQTLEAETRKFFANPDNLSVDHERRRVVFNQILRFYTEDFTPAHAPSLIAYAQRYSALTLPTDYATSFAPYDWTVAHRR